MFAFWLLFLVPLYAVLFPGKLNRSQQRIAWLMVGALFALVVGLRDKVGADWLTYVGHFQDSGGISFQEALAKVDPGHYVLNWCVNALGGSIYWVNLIYAIVFMIGIIAFCRSQPLPWLALLVAVPYMINIVGMGYSRQSVALGCEMLGLLALAGQQTRKFVLWVMLGSIFHKTAVLLIPIAALAASRRRFMTVLLIVISMPVAYYVLLAKSVDGLVYQYVDRQMESDGAMIRVAMNAVPAMLLLVFRRRLVTDSKELKLWLWLAVFALVCLLLVSKATTAVDRMALYLIPLQLYVFGRLPLLEGRNMALQKAIVIGIALYYGIVEFVWLNYATHAKYWIPYHFAPFS